jgi:hypothetical protein
MALTTTRVSAAQLTAAVKAAQVSHAGTANIYVTNPGGAASTTKPFTITAGPTLTSLSSTSAAYGADPFVLTLTGTSFGSATGATVNWGSQTGLTATWVSATSLHFSVTTNMLQSAGPVNVSVTVGGATTSAKVFTVTGSAPVSTPTLTLLNPSSVTAGATGVTVTLTGTGFVAGAKVNWNSAATQLDTAGSGTTLTVSVPDNLLTDAGSVNVSVVNPDTGATGTQTFTINAPAAPAPTVTGISPNSFTLGGSDPIALVVTGSNFTAGDWVGLDFGGSALVLACTVDSDTQISCSNTASYFEGHPQFVGSWHLRVYHQDGTGLATSSADLFTINAAGMVPHIDSISTSSDNHLAGIITITVNGSGFNSAAHPIALNVDWLNWIVSVTPTQIVFQVGSTTLSNWGANPTDVQVENPGNSYSNTVVWNLL